MEKLLTETLDVLENINATLPNPIISEKDFAEERASIEDYVCLKKETNTLVKDMKNTNLNNKVKMTSQIVHLYVNYSSIIWYFEEMRDLTDKIMCILPSENLGPLSESTKAYQEFCIQMALKRKKTNKLDNLLKQIIEGLDKINKALIEPDTTEKNFEKEKKSAKNFVVLREKIVALIDDIQDHIR